VVVNLEQGKDMAEFCVEFGRGLGGDYIEARYVSHYVRGLAFRNGEPFSGGMVPTSGIGVRILVDGNFGFASFDRMDKELAKDAIKSAFKMTRKSKRKEPIDLGESISNKDTWSVDEKQKLVDVDVEDIMFAAKEMNSHMEGLPTYVLSISPSVMDKYIVTNEGTEITGHFPYITIFASMTASGETASEQRFLDLTQCGGWERIKEGKVIEQVEDEVNRLKKAASEAKKIPELMDGPIDMIVGPEVAGIIAHENVGHPSEGDRILGREGAQAGESFWRDLKIGESRVGSDVVTVSEDPTVPNTAGFYLYDDEGIKARKRILIKNGILNEPLLNREFGVQFGLNSNAAARASAFDREPIVRMANTFFEPGDHTFEELLEDVKLGVYMKSFREWNIDDRRYQSKYTGSEAYLIKNGELTDTMVRRPVMETTSVGLLSAVDAVSQNLDLVFGGTCGKSDPAQGVPVYAGGPEIRFRNIRLGGVG
jgi:TldD protein